MSSARRFAPWLGVLLALGSRALAGPYAPAAGLPGSDAVAANDPGIIAWASAWASFDPGPRAIFDASYGLANFGTPDNALRAADVTIVPDQENTFPVVSLGDGGSIVLNFAQPIKNGPGPDLAVFENSFSDTFLELAFVEVSSDGILFKRFPAISLTPTADIQEDLKHDDFSTLDPTNLHNLAGKYRGGYGTPFDLADLAGIAGLDIDNIIAVRIEDVVGSVNPMYGRKDSLGNFIKDPFPTVFPNGGFDLDAVAVLRGIPEPSAAWLLAASAICWLGRRRR